MVVVGVAVFVPYFFYYYSGGPDFGARYWYLMILPLVALTVRGIGLIERKLAQGTAAAPVPGGRVMVAVLALALLALVNYFPWRAIDKYHHFWGMRPDVARLAEENHFGRSLVLVQARESHPDFASAAIYNPLDWRSESPVYAWDRSPEVRGQLLVAFADRPVWFVAAPSVTGRGYQVVGGPVPAADVLARRVAVPTGGPRTPEGGR
jgi:hypothetical protein